MKKKLESYSLDELKKRQKVFKVFNYGLITLMLLYGIVMFYLMFTGSWQAQNPFIVTPIFLFVILMIVNSAKSKVLNEIKKREKNK